ncbi:hypothetical protein NG895_06190 [Aeoliella sp. ICT_H6.2]|uniref:Uncharacterized protein n=1 Tax=Aeoliella straminimaris TaxID=2954799 RepID=A0A9X2FCI9_9BACT|nr:hypothetical protein [Aeoliella straminimaris]MCO6043491.1 hypothetical protein [Aeoliella straminimaris]
MEDENPYAAPQASLESTVPPLEEVGVVRDGKHLLLYEGATLPSRCFSCNQPATHPTKVSAVRNYGLWIAMRLGTIGLVVAGMLVARSYVPRSAEPLVTVAAVLAIALLYGVIRSNNATQFCFYTCTKHRMLRYLTVAIGWCGLLLLLGEAWLAELFPAAGQLDLLLPFIGCILISRVIARKARLQLRCVPNQQQPFMFHGFGGEFLESFPGADEA